MRRTATAKPLRGVEPATHVVRHPDRRRRWVVPELDGRGEIDRHAALCLRLAIEDVVAGAGAEVVIDLRDLTAIDADAIALLSWARTACRARAAQLVLLTGERSPQDRLAHVLGRAGFDTRSHVARVQPERRLFAVRASAPPRPRAWPRGR